MHSLQSIIQQKVLQQINKYKIEPVEAIYITYSSTTKNKSPFEEAVQARKLMQGIQSVHLQKQQSEAIISNVKEDQIDNQSSVNQNKVEEKQGPQKGRFLVRNEYSQKPTSENKIVHTSVMTNKFHKNQRSVGDEGKRIKAEDIWKRRKDYDQKVRKCHLPKIKEYNRFQNNSQNKQYSGQQTAELQFSDIFKDDALDEYQDYNQLYYKKQLLLWNKKQRQFDYLNDDSLD